MDEALFKEMLDECYSKHSEFLKEKTYHEESKRWRYKPRKVRSAYRKWSVNMPLIFTYQRHKILQIPTTTNGLEGGVFSPLKKSTKCS